MFLCFALLVAAIGSHTYRPTGFLSQGPVYAWRVVRLTHGPVLPPEILLTLRPTWRKVTVLEEGDALLGHDRWRRDSTYETPGIVRKPWCCASIPWQDCYNSYLNAIMMLIQRFWIVRISTTADPDNPWFHGTLAAWRHAKCFLEMGWWTCAMDKMSGWDSLTAEDKQAVQNPKQEAGEPLESPGTSSKTPQASNHENKVGGEGKDKKRKPEESEILSCKNQNRVGSTKAKTRKMDGDMGQGSVEETAELEKNLKKQTKLIVETRDNDLWEHWHSPSPRWMLYKEGQRKEKYEKDEEMAAMRRNEGKQKEQKETLNSFSYMNIEEQIKEKLMEEGQANKNPQGALEAKMLGKLEELKEPLGCNLPRITSLEHYFKTELGGSLAPTNTSGFLKILVADNFGMLPLQNEASEDLEEMEHISLALHDTLKYIKRAKARLDYLEAENEELKATQELVRVKLENEFASVPLMSHHHRELEVLAEDQKPLMEVTYQACQYKRMQELAQECMKKEITVSVVQDSKEQDHKDNLTNFHEPSSMDDVQSKP
eukprot:Gb_33060 [translate_table: standard]